MYSVIRLTRRAVEVFHVMMCRQVQQLHSLLPARVLDTVAHIRSNVSPDNSANVVLSVTPDQHQGDTDLGNDWNSIDKPFAKRAFCFERKALSNGSELVIYVLSLVSKALLAIFIFEA